MLATQLPTCMRCVASPISWTVASTSLLTSAANTAAKPASSASRATRRISAARHPTPGISPNAKPSCTMHPPPRGYARLQRVATNLAAASVSLIALATRFMHLRSRTRVSGRAARNLPLLGSHVRLVLLDQEYSAAGSDQELCSVQRQELRS